MALTYQSPGVYVQEISSPSASPLLASPAILALVGMSAGVISKTVIMTMTGTSPIAIPDLPTSSTLVAVTSVKSVLDPSRGATDGSGYVDTTHYTVSAGNKTITRVDAGSTGIQDGEQVYVSLTYTPADYFEPLVTDNLGAIESRFGPALNSTGTAISSHLTFAATMAFLNGATTVVAQPLHSRGTPGDYTTTQTQPTSSTWDLASTWQDSLYLLRDLPEIDVIVPVVGQSMDNVSDADQLAIFTAVVNHLNFMRYQQSWGMAVFGEDFSSGTVANYTGRTTTLSHASSLSSLYGGLLKEATVLLSQGRVGVQLSGSSTPVNIGGQYLAAAVGGMIASRNAPAPLTREYLGGFTGLIDPRTKAQKDDEASKGLCVLEGTDTGIQIRHGVTLDNTSTYKREISIVRGKYFMIDSLRQAIDLQIIGRVPANNDAPMAVNALVTSNLDLLQRQGYIAGFDGVQSRLLDTDPTRVEVRFSYVPIAPLNYVDIIFSLTL